MTAGSASLAPAFGIEGSAQNPHGEMPYSSASDLGGASPAAESSVAVLASSSAHAVMLENSA